MKHLKLFEIFAYGSSSDQYISQVLQKLGIKYHVGTDAVGNDGVFITEDVEKDGHTIKAEIMSSHPDVECSNYYITYYEDDESDEYTIQGQQLDLELADMFGR